MIIVPLQLQLPQTHVSSCQISLGSDALALHKQKSLLLIQLVRVRHSRSADLVTSCHPCVTLVVPKSSFLALYQQICITRAHQ